jgi:hypothetical protein
VSNASLSIFTASFEMRGILRAMLAIVSVFVELPVISNYAFWVMTAAYVMLAGRK